MNYMDFIHLLEERGDLIFIYDRGLVAFAKFVAAALAIFSVIGLFLFGFRLNSVSEDIKKKADEAKQTQIATQEAQLRLTETRQQITAELGRIDEAKEGLASSQEEFRAFVTSSKEQINSVLDEITESRSKALDYRKQIEQLYDLAKRYAASPEVVSASLAALSGASPRRRRRPVPTSHVALLNKSSAHSHAELQHLASILQIQVSRDLKPAWNKDVVISVLDDDVVAVPRGVSPIIIIDKTPQNIRGVNRQTQGIPWSLIRSGSDLCLNISYFLINMLVNPSGEEVRRAPSLDPIDEEIEVDYLLQVASPVSGTYELNGLNVANFVLPTWFDGPEKGKKKAKYDFSGVLSNPLELQEGGYASWNDPGTGKLKQARKFPDFSIVVLEDAASGQSG